MSASAVQDKMVIVDCGLVTLRIKEVGGKGFIPSSAEQSASDNANLQVYMNKVNREGKERYLNIYIYMYIHSYMYITIRKGVAHT